MPFVSASICSHTQKHTDAPWVRSPTIRLLPAPVFLDASQCTLHSCLAWPLSAALRGHLLAAGTSPSSQVGSGAGVAALLAVEPVTAHAVVRY